MLPLILGLAAVAVTSTWLYKRSYGNPPEAPTAEEPTVEPPTPEKPLDEALDPKDKQLHNIYHIAFLLRQKLVPDVVPAILHHAGLFHRHVDSIYNDHPVLITQRSAPYLCLETPPIKSSARVKNPVRKVVFSIQSCDQGWASDSNSGSWTWFTAGVVRREGEGSTPSELIDHDDDDDGDETEELEDMPPEGFLKHERQILRNDVASRTFKHHIVEWTVDSEDEEERRWVSSLQNGDRIAVRAWAQYQGVSIDGYFVTE